MTAITIVFALFGFLSPSNRGSLGTAMIISYTLLGFVGGYVSSRVYKTFGGEAWKRNIVLTPIILPAIVFGTFFLLNLFLWAKRSSGAVPFTTMLVLVGIWFLISLPLSVTGSWVGFKQAVGTPDSPPTSLRAYRTNVSPRPGHHLSARTRSRARFHPPHPTCNQSHLPFWSGLFLSSPSSSSSTSS